MNQLMSREFLLKGLVLLLGAVFLGLFIFSMNADAGYDQNYNDAEDDVYDVENEETTDTHPELDILTITTTESTATLVDVEIIFKADVMTSGMYVYGIDLDDGEEESEHYAEATYSPGFAMNSIDYKNGEDEETVEGEIVVDGTSISFTIDLEKCGIPEDDFRGYGCLGVKLNDEFDVEYADDYPDGSVIQTEHEGYDSTFEVIDDNGDDHENDVYVKVEYDDGEGRGKTPVEGAFVAIKLIGVDDVEFGNGTTDENGEIIFNNLIPMDYLVEIRDDQHGDEEYEEWFYFEVLMNGEEILKVMSEAADIDGDDDLEEGARIFVYYGAMKFFPAGGEEGADIFMDGIYVGQTDANGLLELEGPIDEGHHLIQVEYEEWIIYDDLWMWYFMDGMYEDEMNLDLSNDNRDSEYDDLLVSFNDESGPGDPIQGADVKLDGTIVGQTDENGELYIPDNEDGYHEVEITYDDYTYFEYFLLGTTGTHELGDFDFDGEENDLRFEIQIAEMPLYGTIVSFMVDYEHVDIGGYTNYNGVGYVQEIPPEDYLVAAGNINFRSIENFTFEVTVGEGPAKLHIDTDAPGTIDSEEEVQVTITVTGSGGIQDADILVEYTGDGTITPLTGKTDANGQLVITITADNVTEEGKSIDVDITASEADYEDGTYQTTITIDPYVAPQEIVTEPEEVDLGDGHSATIVAGIVGDLTIDAQTATQPDSDDPDAVGVYLEVTKSGSGTLNWINITIDYSDLPEGIEPSKLKMYYWNEGKQEWVLAENTGVDTVNKRIWANVTHLTIFAPRQQSEGDTTAPEITHEPVLTATAGSDIFITTDVTDLGDGVQSVELYYKKTSDMDYTMMAMSMTRAAYTGTIPGASVTTDGVEYYIKASDGTNIALDPGVDMSHYVTVTEGGAENHAPEVTVTNPATGDNVTGTISITWTAVDPDGDNMMYTIKISNDSGETWTDIRANLHSLVSLTWDLDTNTNMTPNGDTYRIKIIASDDNGTVIKSGSNETGDFTIHNEGNEKPDDIPDDKPDDTTDDEEDDSPGFQLIISLIAVGIAVVLFRRKNL